MTGTMTGTGGGRRLALPATVQRFNVRGGLGASGVEDEMANKKTQRTSRQTRRGSASKLKMSIRRSTGRRSLREPEFGGMTVREAGRKGGLIGGRKGGLAVKAERGREFYQEIGRKGGQRVRDLIAAGRRTEERGTARRRHT